VTRAAPYYLPLTTENIMGRYGAERERALLPETIYPSRFGTAAGLYSGVAPSLGTYQRGTSEGSGIGYNWASAFGENLFGGLGKRLSGAGGSGQF
jgi:hypothetical protein